MDTVINGYGIVVATETWQTVKDLTGFKNIDAYSDLIQVIKLDFSDAKFTKQNWFVGYVKSNQQLEGSTIVLQPAVKPATVELIDSIFRNFNLFENDPLYKPEPLVIIKRGW